MPLTGLSEAVLTHEVIFAADLSQQLGRPVKLTELRNGSESEFRNSKLHE
jgi:hypothetical protein